MNNNEITTLQNAPTLADYSPARNIDLVQVRRDPVKFPRIKATERGEAIARMTRIVYAAFLYRNQSTTKTIVNFTAEALVNEIMADRKYGLQNLSWLEIGMTIRAAVLGEGKEMYGVSVASLYAALVDYAKGEGHDASNRAQIDF